jgi:large subunit ribosomal protein L30
MAKKKKTPMLNITLLKSPYGRTVKQRKTLEALGLRKINQTVERPDQPSIRGMIERVQHLVKVD